MSDFLSLLFLIGALFLLYKFFIPFLFPSVVHGVGIIKPGDSEEVYAFQGGRVPFVNTEKGSHSKALRRRKNEIYTAAGV